MRFINKGVVAGVAAMSVLALGASSASATITPSSGAVTARNTGSVTLTSPNGLTNTCTTLDFAASINMNNATTQGGGGIVTGMTADGCDLGTTGDFETPWTLNINNEISAGTWAGVITNISLTIGGICTFTGNLLVEYTNSTGLMSITTGGALAGSPSFLCGHGTVTGKWDLRTTGGAIPQAS